MLELRLLIISSIEPIFKQTVETVVPKKSHYPESADCGDRHNGDRCCCDGS